MDISKNYIEQILKTLPIGYYAKRNIRLTLSEDAECSFYSQSEDSITVSYKQLLPTFQKLTDSSNIESKVRCMLYHEVSHAILTPENMEMNRERNIVEDERIETIFKNFYFDVDFKQFVKEVNDYQPNSAKTAEEAFYALVRFREGTIDWLNRLSLLLKEFKNLDRYNNHKTNWYSYRIDEFAKDFYDWYNQNQQVQDTTRQNNANSTENTDNGNSTQLSLNTQTSLDSNINDDLTKIDINHRLDSDLSTNANTHIKPLVALKDQAIIDSFGRIISNVAKIEKNNGSAINAYSGVFDPRAVERNDYKYFVQKNRLGNIKKFSKVHFNLFIDRSGSFRDSEKFVNQMIYALGVLERTNPDFTFTLITCGIGQTICDKHHRELHCKDGTGLSEDIFEQFKQVQVPTASNFNIVLYDGDAFYSCYGQDKRQLSRRFKAFDTKNTLIITDRENRNYIENNIRQAKYIICKDYANELYKQLLASIEKLLR